MDRLDRLVDAPTRNRNMGSRGHTCTEISRRTIDEGFKRRRQYESIEAFLDAEEQRPSRGTRLEREGDILYQYYAPDALRAGLRC